MFDITVIGNVGIDTNVYHPKKEIDFDVEANFTTNMDYIGQAGGYSARGFAQLGYKTAFIGYVGEDYHGRFIKDTFQKDNINIDGMFIDPAGTSRSVNFMYSDGQRKNFYDGKSHMTITPDLEKCSQIIAQSKLLHFNIPDWARKLLPIAQKQGKIISVDIQDIVTLDDEYRQDFIHYADVIFFSCVNFSTPATLMDKILEKYPEKIIVSGMGNRGCALGTKAGVEFFDAIEFGDPVVDTNGAGDGLAVGFLSQRYIQNKSLQEAIKAGQIVARYTCTQKASTDHLITSAILESRMK